MTEAVRRVGVRYHRDIVIQFVETPVPFFDELKNALESRTVDLVWTRMGTNVPDRALSVDFSCNYFVSRNALYSTSAANGGVITLATIPANAVIGYQKNVFFLRFVLTTRVLDALLHFARLRCQFRLGLVNRLRRSPIWLRQ